MNLQSENTGMNSRITPIVLLAAMLLVGFSWGRWSAPLAAWLGPLLFIRFYREQKPGRGYWPLLAACILSTAIGWWQVFPPSMGLFIFLFYGLLMSVPYVVDRLLSPRLSGFISTLVYPLAAGSLEFVNRLINPIGDWGAVGYTQFGNMPLMQLASVTGVIGITFLIGWFASATNWAWEALRRRHVGEVIGGAAFFGAIMAVVLVYGSLRLALAPLPAKTVRVAGITSESAVALLRRWHQNPPDTATVRAEVKPLQDAYFDATLREARAGAQVVVWSEVSAIGIAGDEAALIARAQEIAKQEKIYLTVPLYVIYPEGQPSENKLLIVDPAGEVVLEHMKYGGNFIEGSRRGDQHLQTVTTPFGVLSGVICWDMDFPDVIRQVGQSDAGLLLVPAGDWFEVTPLHAQMAMFRAIENGTALVRQTDMGLSIASDPYGRALAQMNYFASNDRTLVAQVPTEHVPTLYLMGGYLSGWLILVGLGVMLVLGSMAARQRN